MSAPRRTETELEDRVLAALARVLTAPEGPDVVAAGHIHSAVATGGVVRVLIDPERIPPGAEDALADAITPIVRAVPGVERLVVKPRPRPPAGRTALPGVRQVLAVHSAKGGVGKSTIATNLAVALAASGWRTGLLDADVYGPSAPVLLGLSGRVETDGARIVPRRAHGLEVMSLGFLMPEGKALAWRGALVEEGLPQLLSDVAWGELDCLIVDLPPGTSDVHLALAEHVPLGGVVTVTTPGHIAVQDAQRGLEMFADLAVPCLGLVENMAALCCSRCGHLRTVFGRGGGAQLAARTGLELLARIPFVPEVVELCEAGRPLVLAAPDSEVGQALRTLAATLERRLGLTQMETVS